MAPDFEPDYPHAGGFYSYAREAKFNNNNPIVIYTPPAGIMYEKKVGQFVMEVPVFNQDTAYAAVEKMTEALNEFVRSGNPDPYLNYPMRTRQINLERLFRIWELLQPVKAYIESEAKK